APPSFNPGSPWPGPDFEDFFRAMTLPSQIAVNASILGSVPTGLGHYALGLVRALDALRDGLIVYTSYPEALSGLRATVRRTSHLTRPERGMRGHGARLFWTQSALRGRGRLYRPRVRLTALPEGILGSRVPQVTVVHDVIPLAFPSQYPRQQFYFRRLVPAVLRASRAVIAVSEATKREVIAAYGLSPDR